MMQVVPIYKRRLTEREVRTMVPAQTEALAVTLLGALEALGHRVEFDGRTVNVVTGASASPTDGGDNADG